MINIIITNEVAGKAHLYERQGKQGKRTLVPTFLATAVNTVTGESYTFAVTRDASRLVFGPYEDRYGTNGECPPNKPGKPYRATRSETETGLFCLLLSEVGMSLNDNALQGLGDTIRTDIMIHNGPGMSEGCFILAGGRAGHRRFERWFKPKVGCDTAITVEVLPCS